MGMKDSMGNVSEPANGLTDKNDIILATMTGGRYEREFCQFDSGQSCVFNNWAVFHNGKFETVHLLNEGSLKKCWTGIELPGC